MDPFDTECPRCHGKGLSKPTEVKATEVKAAPTNVAAPLSQTSPFTSSTNANQPATNNAGNDSNVAINATSPLVQGGPLPYFFAVYESGDSKLFRVYADSDALLFIFAGPYHMSLVDGLKAMRGEPAGDAALMPGEVIGRSGLIAGRAGAIAGAGMAGAGIGMLAAGIGGGLLLAGAKMAAGQIDKRTQVLDAMSADQLRHEANTVKGSFRVAPDNTSNMQLLPVKSGIFSSDDATFTGYLQFAHKPSGKWKLKFFTHLDAQSAIQECGRVMGSANIIVQIP
jgi:hypothetical protein